MKHAAQLVPSVEYRRASFRDAARAAEVFAEHAAEDVPLVNPATMTEAERRTMLAQIESRELLAIRFAARVFGDRPNANLIRPRPELTHELADTAPGKILLHDHNSRASRDRVGNILASKIVQGDAGIDEIVDLVEIRDPDTMARFVRGLLDEFSIGVEFDAAECSFCGAEAASFWGFVDLTCECELGATKLRDDGSAQFVEVWTTGNARRELSFVNFGAYPDTEVRATFERRHNAAQQAQTRREDVMSEKTQAAPTAPDETAAVGNGPATASHDEELKALRAQLAASQEAAKAASEAAFRTIFSDGVKSLKFGPAQESAMRAVFSAHCGNDASAFLAYVADLPSNPAYSATATGVASTEPVSHAAQPADDPLALIKRGVEFGLATNKNLEALAARVERMRFID